MRKILKLAFLLSLPASASAQIAGQALSLSGKPLPFAQITVCAGISDVLIQNSQQVCNAQTPLNPPSQPVLTAVAAAAPVAGTYQVVVTYTNAVGETIGSVSNSLTTSGGNLGVQVTSPAAFSNSTGWNVYFTTAGGATFFKQNSTPTAIGTNYTQTTAINTGGVNPPTATTATNAILPLASIFSNVAQTIVLSNPFSADGNGRFTAFASAGSYSVSIASPGYTTYSYPAASLIVPAQPVTTSAVAHQWVNSYTSATGLFTQTQPAFADISGTIALGQLPTGIPNANLANSSITVNNPSFMSGWGAVSLGGSLSPTWNTQSQGTFLAGPCSGSGAVAFRVLCAADLPTASIPVADLTPGSNSQCVITSAGATVWGSCTGTTGVQTLTADGTATTVNANTATSQNLKSFTITAGSINAVPKTVRIHGGGTFTPVNTSETVQFIVNGPGGLSPGIIMTPSSTANGIWLIEYSCTVFTVGSLGAMGCTGYAEMMDGAGVLKHNPLAGNPGINLTLAQLIQFTVTFSTASTSNISTQQQLIVEQLN